MILLLSTSLLYRSRAVRLFRLLFQALVFLMATKMSAESSETASAAAAAAVCGTAAVGESAAADDAMKVEKLKAEHTGDSAGSSAAPVADVQPPVAASKSASKLSMLAKARGSATKKKPADDPFRFQGDGVDFKAKLIGTRDVAEARGDQMCQDAIMLCKASVKASGQHKQRVLLNISLEGLKIRDEKTGSALYQFPVTRISFIARDMTDARAFGFVYGSPEEKHKFYAVKTAQSADQTVLAIRDMFQVVYDMKKKQMEDAKLKSADQTSAAQNGAANGQTDQNANTKPSEPATVQDLVDLEFEIATIGKEVEHMAGFQLSSPGGDFPDPRAAQWPPSPDRSAASSTFATQSSVPSDIFTSSGDHSTSSRPSNNLANTSWSSNDFSNSMNAGATSTVSAPAGGLSIAPPPPNAAGRSKSNSVNSGGAPTSAGSGGGVIDDILSLYPAAPPPPPPPQQHLHFNGLPTVTPAAPNPFAEPTMQNTRVLGGAAPFGGGVSALTSPDPFDTSRLAAIHQASTPLPYAQGLGQPPPMAGGWPSAVVGSQPSAGSVGAFGSLSGGAFDSATSQTSSLFASPPPSALNHAFGGVATNSPTNPFLAAAAAAPPPAAIYGGGGWPEQTLQPTATGGGRAESPASALKPAFGSSGQLGGNLDNALQQLGNLNSLVGGGAAASAPLSAPADPFAAKSKPTINALQQSATMQPMTTGGGARDPFADPFFN